MNRDVTQVATAPTHTASLAFACMAVWTVAAASTAALGIWMAIGGAAVVLGVAVFALDWSASKSILQPRPRLVLLGAALGGLVTAATYLLYPVLVRIAPSLAGETTVLYSAFRKTSFQLASLAIAPVILGEELVWRGVVLETFTRRLGHWGGVTLAAGVYALALAPIGSPVLVFVALLCGLLWGALRAASGSLVPTLVAHLVWDVCVLLWLPLESN